MAFCNRQARDARDAPDGAVCRSVKGGAVASVDAGERAFDDARRLASPLHARWHVRAAVWLSRS